MHSTGAQFESGAYIFVWDTLKKFLGSYQLCRPHPQYNFGVTHEIRVKSISKKGKVVKTERCDSNGSLIKCRLVEPTLDWYEFYPEMMSVPPDYCVK